MQYIQTTIGNIDDFLSLPRLLPGFIFRGQANSQWGLTTSLERALGNRIDRTIHLKTLELSMLRRFKQRRHLYALTPLDENDVFEWLAELQHYGAPTRLLDFSRSPYVAAYFATCNTEIECSVWATNYLAIIDYLRSENFTSPFSPTPPDGGALLNQEMSSDKWDISSNYVVALESSRPNIRIIRQQGLFLAQIATRNLNERLPFEDCLASTFGSPKLPSPEIINFNVFKSALATLPMPQIIKVNIPLDIKSEIQSHLNCMGINAESLFPGLDGLALSLFQSSQLDGYA